jgi:hypothetical protein
MLQKTVANGAKHRNHKCFLLFTDDPETIGLYMISSVLRVRVRETERENEKEREGDRENIFYCVVVRDSKKIKM